MKTIKIQFRNSFGMERIYPVCETAYQFTKLTGHKTMSREELKVIKTLGYEIEIVPADISLEEFGLTIKETKS